MFSRSSRRLLLPRLGLFAIGVILPVACAAGAPNSAPKPAADAQALLPLQRLQPLPPFRRPPPPRESYRAGSGTPTPTASGSSGATVRSAPSDGSAMPDGSASNGSPAATVYGLSAPELLGWRRPNRSSNLRP